MINPSFRELEDINKSRYAICVIASKRARKLIEGEKPLVKVKTKNPVAIAIAEIMEGKVVEKKD